MSLPPFQSPPQPPGQPAPPNQTPYGAPPQPGYGGFGQGPPQPPTGPAKGRATTVILIIVVVVAALFGCGIFASLGIHGFRRYMERARAARSASPISSSWSASGSGAAGPSSPLSSHLLLSTDGHSQITIPPSWRSMPELGGEGVVRAGDVLADEYLLVITETKVDFAAQVDLAKYGEIVIGAMEKTLTNPMAGPPIGLTIGGRPALQYELHGTVDLINIGYLVTVIDGVTHYHQVLAWTSKSKLLAARASLQRTIATFRER